MAGPTFLGTVVSPTRSKHLLPVAEHGFSVLIRAKNENKSATVLFDTGVSKKGFLHDLDTLEIKANDIQAIILSHGHRIMPWGYPELSNGSVRANCL